MMPFCDQRYSWIWQITIVAHEAMMPSAATLSTISNAFSGTTPLSRTPNSPMTAVRQMPPYGTPRDDIRDVNLGALPLMDMDRRIRPVEYRPALRLEKAAVSTTPFMIGPAPDTPILEKNVTNGLSWLE